MYRFEKSTWHLPVIEFSSASLSDKCVCSQLIFSLTRDIFFVASKRDIDISRGRKKGSGHKKLEMSLREDQKCDKY